MAATLQRITKSFAIHLFLLLIAVGLIHATVRGQESLSAGLRMQYEGQSADVLLQLIADARGRIVAWAIATFAVGWLASSIFLASAQRTQPANERQAGSRTGLWSLMLIVVVIVTATLAWLRLFQVGVSTDLVPGGFMTALVGGGVLVLLAYYLATALAVKAAMRPSVPGASALPDFWS